MQQFLSIAFGTIGLTFGAGLGVQGAFSILNAKRPHFMQAFERYQLLRRKILLHGREESLLTSGKFLLQTTVRPDHFDALKRRIH